MSIISTSTHLTTRQVSRTAIPIAISASCTHTGTIPISTIGNATIDRAGRRL
jgi:hypothetical protein